MSTPNVPAVVFICYKDEKKNFKEMSLREAGVSWWKRGFKKETVSVQVSTEHFHLGVHTICSLHKVPDIFDRITLPVMVNGQEQVFPLVVLRVEPIRKSTSPLVVRCAFDFALTQEAMSVCSAGTLGSFGIPGEAISEFTNQWIMSNAKRLVEVSRMIRSGQLKGFTIWGKAKVIPCSRVAVS